MGEASQRSMRSQKKGKGWRAISDLLSLVIVLFGMNSLIDFLKGLNDSEIRVYEIARASNSETHQAEAMPHMPAHENDKPVYPLSGEFTAYSPSVDQTDDRPREMASGKEVYEGSIACPDQFVLKDGKRVFGTKIEIEGLGTFVCEDRMGKRYRDKMNFDIFMESEDAAWEFGRRHINFKVLP